MKAKNFLCFIVVLFFSLVNLSAKPQKDSAAEREKDLSLYEIDKLIRKTEYDEALRQLNIYIENNPENFDNAQIRIKRIMNARKQYSILAEKLIELILNDPNNNKEIYEITAQLEKFERHPSAENLQFIADLKKSAEFNYFRALFMEIQNESARLTQKKQYSNAIAKVQEGFWLYKDNFYEQWEDNTELLDEVNTVLAQLDNEISTFNEKNFLTSSKKVVDEFINLVNNDKYDEALAVCQNFSNSLNNYFTVRNTIMNCGTQMQNLFAKVQTMDADTSDASFLPFMFRFIFGIDSVPDSGIEGALDYLWNDYLTQMNNAVYSQLNKKYVNFTGTPNNEYLFFIKKYTNLEQKLLDSNELLAGGNVNRIKSNYTKYYVTSDYLANLSENTVRICLVSDEVEKENQLQKKILNELALQNESNREITIKNLFDSNARIGNLVGVKSQQILENLEWTNDYTAAEYTDWQDLSNKYTQILDQIFIDSSGMLNGSWKTLAEYYQNTADTICQNVELNNLYTRKYFDGFYVKIPSERHSEILKNPEKAFVYVNTFETDENLNFGVYYSYPDISIKAAVYTQSGIEKDLLEITEYQKILYDNYSSHEQWTLDENITQIVNDANEYLEKDKKKLLELKDISLAYGKESQSHVVAAQLAQNEADLRFAEAEAALSRDNFDMARKKLQDAVAKYDEALKNQDDAILQMSCDDKLFRLGERITKGENEIVVREVRQLKNRAKDAYLNGRFDDAEKYLIEAKTRWAVTNAVEDGEITNLMNFVNTAISMKTGREILPSAPQYPEMSQLLSIANQYYESGTDKISKNDMTGGESDLDLALQSIQKVQYTYPLNRDAALLTLKINKLRDPEKFNEELSQKIDLAKLMCKRKDSQQEGYANLLDYYDIEPDYRGLKELIYQVEIDIGIRQKPVDNSGAKKAEKLYKDAEKMFKAAGEDTTKLKAALAKIEESIALQSDNEAAIELKDRITIKIGGTTSVTLSTDDERLYKSAIAKLQSNDIFGANIIVQQLLKNPRNANSQQIKDLKSKVDARL